MAFLSGLRALHRAVEQFVGLGLSATRGLPGVPLAVAW